MRSLAAIPVVLVAALVLAAAAAPAAESASRPVSIGVAPFEVVAPPGEAPPPPEPRKPERSESPGSLWRRGSFDSGAPLTIRSDSLDAFQEEGQRRLVFTQNVKATQADLRITSDRLEAIYPGKASQPERLIAEGRVVVARGLREARCDRATYERKQRLLVCRGNAELREGEDRVTGARIEFDFDAERVVVTGGASVVIQPEGGGGRDDPESGSR